MNLNWRNIPLFATLVVATVASCGGDKGSGREETRVASSLSALSSLLPAINNSPAINTFVVYARQSVVLGSLDHSVGGDIGVAAASGAGAQMVVSSGDILDPLHNLYSPSVFLNGLSVVGDVETNQLQNNGGILGVQAAYPASAMPPLPGFFPSSPGSTNVTVPASQVQTLNPGSYGVLAVGGTVFLNPGTYSFAGVALANGAALIAQPGGPTSLQIAGAFSMGSFARAAPAGQTANALTISVGAADGPGGTPPAATIGASSQITALLATPHGTVNLGNNVELTGAVAASAFVAGDGVLLNFQSGFPVQTPIIATFVAYGERSVVLGTGDHSFGGDIGVALAAAPAFGPQLVVGPLDGLDLAHSLFAPTVSLASLSQVGDVEANTLTNNGGFPGAQVPFPAVMPPMPLGSAATPGTTNVSVGVLQVQTLTPGNYGTLADNGTLLLSPGAYSFSSVTLGTGAQILVRPGGTSRIGIAGSLTTGRGAQILAVAQTADHLAITVSGGDGATGAAAASFGANSQVASLLAVPHGTLSLGDGTQALGAFAAFDLRAGNNVTLTFQTGFPPSLAAGQQQLNGYVTPPIAAAPIAGPLPPSTPLDIAVGLLSPNAAGLPGEVQAVSDPKSAGFRQYLDLPTFQTMFSPSTTTYQQVVSWAQSAGLTVTQTYDSRLLLDASGTAGQIEQALNANLVLRLRPDGTQFYSLDREPSLSLSLTAPVLRISGLDNRVLAAPAAGSGPGGLYASADVRAAYASCTAFTGQGQTVGLFELDGFTGSDITAYECQTGLATCSPAGAIIAGTVPSVPTVKVDGFNGSAGSGAVEVTADIQLAIAMAPGLTSVKVFEAQNDGSLAHSNDILSKMAADTSTKQFSSSWTFASDGNTQAALDQMAITGQSFVEAVGDQGSSSWAGDPSDVRDDDAVTVVGGTTLTMSGAPPAYQSETTWNIKGQGAGGGGVASNTVIPLYQSSVDVTSAGGNPGHRNLPDVSMVATALYQVLNGNIGGCTPSGCSFPFFLGTSAAAPLWAGYVALANQQAQSIGVGTVGFANPFIYGIGQAAPPIYAASFNDINDKSNNAGTCQGGAGGSSPCSGTWLPNATGGFAAGPGYDLATGWGTPKCALLNELGTSVIALPTPDAGTSGETGADGAAPPTPVSIAIVATEGSHGVEFCMQGQGFAPGHAIQFEFLDVPDNIVPSTPSDQGPILVASDGTFTDFDPTFGGGASSEFGYSNCTVNDSNRSMTIQATDQSAPLVVALATITNKWICGEEPVGETPLPMPPTFGQTTCPAPPP